MSTYILRDLYNKVYDPDVVAGGTMTNGLSSTDFSYTSTAPNFLPAGAHTITHATGDRLITADDTAAFLANPQVGYPVGAKFTFTLNVNGMLSGTTNNGLVLENTLSASANKVTVGKDGSIGGLNNAFIASAWTNIDNNGVISSGGLGRAIVFDGFAPGSNIKATTTTTINNNLGAVIAGGTHGIEYNGLGKLVVANKGIIVGSEATSNNEGSGNAIQSFDGTVVVTNEVGATISGSIRAGWLNSSVTNKGLIEGTIRAHMYTEEVPPGGPGSDLTGYIDYNRNGTPANQPGDKHYNNITETGMTVTNSGTVDGTDNWGNDNGNTFEVALDLSHAKDVVTNTGIIFGVVDTHSGNDIITNEASGKIYGDIYAGSGGQFYQAFGAYALDADTLTNKGLIDGSVYTNLGKDTVTNNGEITGRIEIGIGNYDAANATGEDYDTLTNTGLIRGNIWTGLGDDVVTNSGTMDDGLDMSAWPGDYDSGTNTWTWNNDTTSANKEFDNDKDKLTNTGVIAGLVSMGHGADTVTNSNLIRGDLELGSYSWVGNFDDGIPATPVDLAVFQADDKDTVTNTGTVTGYIWTGLGADVITNSGYTSGIFTTDNNRSFTTDDGEPVTITIPVNAGSFDIDTVTNTGTVRDEIWTGVGDDKVMNKATGKVTDGGIYTGDGADIIENDGFVAGDVAGGNGSDKITNKGTIRGNVYLGTDGATNTLINTKIIGGSVLGSYGLNPGDPDLVAQGNNNIDNSGTIAGDISLGGGTDNVKNLGTGRIEGEVSLGGGQDTFTGNATNEYIQDEAGGDKYVMGAGNDRVFMDTVDLDQDTFDGGVGNDTLSFDGVISTTNVTVNLSVVTAQTVAYSLPGSQQDKALNFENVTGGAGNDSLVGSAVTNEISGGDGNDFITGGGGQDYLAGGNGADTFVYNFVTDSAPGTADIIRDFSTVDDTIDLNTIITGTTFTQGDFTTTLSGGNGQWRTSTVGGNTVLEINTDADLSPDMIILLQGIFTLTNDDFVI
jgi:serralysin